MVEVPTEEMPAVATPAETMPGVVAPAAMETPVENPWEATVAAAAVASASECDLDTWRPRTPVREGTWAMVQPGIPPAFDCNEGTKIEALEGYDQANYDIKRALAFALDIHRGFHLQVSNVSVCPAACPFVFLWFLAHAFPLAAAEADVA